MLAVSARDFGEACRVLLWQLIVLAVVQGITEFLPISSSGHLVLVPVVTGWPDQGPWFDVAVHLGSLLAVMLYFRRDVAGLCLGLLQALRRRDTEQARLVGYVTVATIPAVVFGAGLVGLDLLAHLRSATLIGVTSIGFGLLLYVADVKVGQQRSLAQLTWRDAMLIGLAQALALIPGTSRAGITVTAGRVLALTRTEAARFSMLLAIPTIVGAGVLQAVSLARAEVPAGYLGDLLIAGGLAFATALASIALMMRWLARASYTPFVVYRVGLGVLLLIAVAAGWLPG